MFISNLNHGVGFQGDLPIPFDTILNVSAWVIILTFVFLKISWKESILTTEEKLFSNKQTFVGKFFGFIILFLLIAPGLIGREGAKTSIAPLILWVFLWIGIPILGLLFGDLYAKFNPLNIFLTNDNKPQSVYVACVLFLGLTWFELVWTKPGNPLHIGIVFIMLFVVVNSFKLFFNKTSIEIDPLLLLHHLYSKLRIVNSKPIFRTLLQNISNLSRIKGMEYFILLMIGTVTYDGLRETVFWYNQFGTRVYDMAFSTLAFLTINLLLILFYRFACYFSIKVSDSDYSVDEVSLAFGHSMLPIAFAYHVTHYLSLFLFESQTFLYRLNDPIGTGLDLFGVNQVTVEYFLDPLPYWTIQVVVTLIGHVLSVFLAHDLAVKLFGHEQSDKTQYIFLLITVVLTLQALFVLSVP